MLPCQATCSNFQNGCHKACPRWKLLQDEQRSQRQAKKQYLRFYSTQCALIIHQFEAMQARYPAR